MAVFRLISATDLPLVQVLIGCIVGRLFSDRAHWQSTPSVNQTENAAATT